MLRDQNVWFGRGCDGMIPCEHAAVQRQGQRKSTGSRIIMKNIIPPYLAQNVRVMIRLYDGRPNGRASRKLSGRCRNTNHLWHILGQRLMWRFNLEVQKSQASESVDFPLEMDLLIYIFSDIPGRRTYVAPRIVYFIPSAFPRLPYRQ